MIEDKKKEEAAHVVALRSYARSAGISEEFAIATYRRELESLSASANVTRFIGIIAEKRAKDALRDQIGIRSQTHTTRVDHHRLSASEVTGSASKRSGDTSREPTHS